MQCVRPLAMGARERAVTMTRQSLMLQVQLMHLLTALLVGYVVVCLVVVEAGSRCVVCLIRQDLGSIEYFKDMEGLRGEFVNDRIRESRRTRRDRKRQRSREQCESVRGTERRML